MPPDPQKQQTGRFWYLPAGTEVEKKGESGDWIQIEYEGSEAYVFGSLLEEKTE